METIGKELELLIQSYSYRANIATMLVIDDLNRIIKTHINNKTTENTLLEDVQNTYILKHGKLPMRYKNDITRLSNNI